MPSENIQPYIIMIGIASIASLFFGLFGILNKKNLKNSPQFYISINFLITGIMMGFLFVFYIFYILKWIGQMSKDDFYKLLTAGMAISLFISGMYGVLNKKKINNPTFYRFARQGVIGSIIIMIGLVAYWLMWHH